MKMLTMKNLHRALVISTCGFMITACSAEESIVTAIEEGIEEGRKKALALASEGGGASGTAGTSPTIWTTQTRPAPTPRPTG